MPLNLIEPHQTSVDSPIEPRCRHAFECGGCSFQHLAYSSQLERKQQEIVDLFSPFLEEGTLLYPIIPCESPWEYRNKMEFSFSQDRAGNYYLGLMLKKSRGRVLDLAECHLVDQWQVHALEAVREWWKKSGLAAYHRFKDTGSLRNLTLRQSKHTSGKMAMLTVSGNPSFALTQLQINQFVQAVHSTVPEDERATLSIFIRIQQIAKGTPTQFFEMLVAGPDHLMEQLTIDNGQSTRTLNFKISPTSFFQPNTVQCEKLYSQALKMAGQRRYPLIFDLYCGTGTLSLAMASLAEKVIGIEINPHAIFDAQSNQEENQIVNVEFLCGDVGKILDTLKAQEQFIRPGLIMIDPPRSGLDPKAIELVLNLQAEEILYISCNPKTQANDVQMLHRAGYKLIALQPVDQFPHTPHIENIAVIRRVS